MSPISYRIVRPAERKIALHFMECWGHRWHGCSPPPTKGEIIAAFKDNKIIGTVVLDLYSNDKPFSLELIYDFSHIQTYTPNLPKNCMVQGGRWFASKPGVSRMLLHAIAEYAIPHGAEYLIAEVKETSIKILEGLGIRFVILCGVSPCLDSIPIEGLKYYVDLPPPRLMIIKLSLLYMEEHKLLK